MENGVFYTETFQASIADQIGPAIQLRVLA